jgi:anaerobic selenocysteine-containing dehydrogenase
VEHSPSLRFLSTRARAEISVADAREAGVENGDELRLATDDTEVVAVAAVRSTVPPGSVFVIGADLSEGPVHISPARQPVAAS